MAIIGTFTQNGNGLTGSVKTLTLNAKDVELGAAWKRTSKEGRSYHSVKLDDPSFPAPIYASLIEGEDGASNLIWSR